MELQKHSTVGKLNYLKKSTKLHLA